MYKRPYVAGINADRILDQGYGLERLLSAYGTNIGNIFFSEALFRVIPGAKAGSLHFDVKELEDCDAIVVAAANWLNPYSDFGDLAERLKKTGLPVIIVGVGAQSPSSDQIPDVKEGTLELIRLAAETSQLISTRGGFSSRVLEHYGFRNVLATGCPSLLMNGSRPPRVPQSPHGATADEIVIHSTRHLLNNCSPFQTSLYRRAMSEKMDIVLQSELADMFASEGAPEAIEPPAADILSKVYGAAPDEVRAYLRSHGKLLLTIEKWVDFLRGKRFCVGTRLHGTVAALLAGIPAVLIAHDSRTVETARAMHIPLVRPEEVDAAKDLTSLFDKAAAEALTDGYERYFQNFKTFFHLNGLEIKGERAVRKDRLELTTSVAAL